MDIDLRVFHIEVIAGHRLKRLAKEERAEEKGRRLKTSAWEMLESRCGKISANVRIRALLLSRGCGERGFHNERRSQHWHAREMLTARSRKKAMTALRFFKIVSVGW